MMAMMLHIKTFLAARMGRLHDDEAGVTATEYAIMLVLVSLAVVVAVPDFRNGVINTFATTQATLNSGLDKVAEAGFSQ